MDYDLISFIIRSKSRRVILESLCGSGVSTPSALSSELNINRTHVSRGLKELQAHGLVEQLTGSRKGRVYGITSKGKKVIDEIKKLHL